MIKSAPAPMARASDPRWYLTLVESLMRVPDADGVSAATLAMAWREARERARFLADVEVRSAGQLADAAMVGRWVAARSIVAIEHDGALRLPMFQFDTVGTPHPQMESALSALQRDGWNAALWFHRRNDHLGDRRPMDLLLSDAEGVCTAARRDAEDLARL